ncbi:glutathione S-transferase family protein [uncultured Erythrobacter sp.]|uniref:glutathione S-transferase family protein n=1 Tax=uncultured Erythrobacter sp. TaxID=263913 RepID=UPI0026051B27|nr:glutathione S-transferase family protein [uncultured Erythrobacter sp.]
MTDASESTSTDAEVDTMLVAGTPGSPYTRKLISVLRYRRVPHRVRWIDPAARQTGRVLPKVPLLPIVYFDPGEANSPAIDSTPIVRRTENLFEGRSVIPPDPALAFLNDLIEDYADEWLAKPVFHFRWSYDEHVDWISGLLTYWDNPALPSDEGRGRAKSFAERQIARMPLVGASSANAPTIERSYREFLRVFDLVLETGLFLFGERPSSADFAIQGQLSQLVGIDHASKALADAVSPRLRAWTDFTDDLSGFEPVDAWIDLETVAERLRPLLLEIGNTYAPYMTANAAAMDRREERFDAHIYGGIFSQPVFRYQGKCLSELKCAFAGLSSNDQERVCRAVSQTGIVRMLDW